MNTLYWVAGIWAVLEAGAAAALTYRIGKPRKPLTIYDLAVGFFLWLTSGLLLLHVAVTK